jgi:hypothetical protein
MRYEILLVEAGARVIEPRRSFGKVRLGLIQLAQVVLRQSLSCSREMGHRDEAEQGLNARCPRRDARLSL